MEVSGQLHDPTALPQGKSPRYLLDWRLGGLQSRSGCDGEEKNSQLPPGFEPRSSDRPARSQSLFRLALMGGNIKMNLGGILCCDINSLRTFCHLS